MDWELPFHISSDTYETIFRSTLGQEEDEKPYTIYYTSKKLAPMELNYMVIEKEFLVFLVLN
jgi:hypothetical protein